MTPYILISSNRVVLLTARVVSTLATGPALGMLRIWQDEDVNDILTTRQHRSTTHLAAEVVVRFVSPNNVMTCSFHTPYSPCGRDEDHTLGNALRHVLMQNDEVDFCGYSVPHPSEPKMNLRLQTTGAHVL